jgi:hypothetical protein
VNLNILAPKIWALHHRGPQKENLNFEKVRFFKIIFKNLLKLDCWFCFHRYVSAVGRVNGAGSMVIKT